MPTTFREALLDTNDQVTLIANAAILSVSPSSLNFGSLAVETIVFIEAELNTNDEVMLVVHTAVLSVSPSSLNFGSLVAGTPVLIEDLLNVSDQVTAVGSTLSVSPASLNFGSLVAGAVAIFVEDALNTVESSSSISISTSSEIALNPSELLTVSGLRDFSDSTVLSDQVILNPNLLVSPTSLDFGSLSVDIPTFTDIMSGASDDITGVAGQQSSTDTDSLLSDLIYLQASMATIIDIALSPNDGTTSSLTSEQIIDMITTVSESIISSGLIPWTDRAASISDQVNQLGQTVTVSEPALSLGDSATTSSLQNSTETLTGANESSIAASTQSLTDSASLADLFYSPSVAIDTTEPALNPNDDLTQAGAVNLLDFLQVSESLTFVSLIGFSDQDSSLSDGLESALPALDLDEPLGVAPLDAAFMFGLQILGESAPLSDQITSVMSIMPITEGMLVTNDDVQSTSSLSITEIDNALSDTVAFLSPPVTYTDVISQAQEGSVLLQGTYSPIEDVLSPNESVSILAGTFIETTQTSESLVPVGIYRPVEPAIDTASDLAIVAVDLTKLSNYALAYFTFRGGYSYGYSQTQDSDLSPWYIGQTEPPLLGVLRSDSGRPINLETVSRFTLMINSQQSADRIGTGKFQVVKASQGIVVYFWGVNDAALEGKFSIQIVTQDTYGTDKSDLVDWNIIAV